MWNKTEPEYFDMMEKPPAGSGEIKDYNSAKLLQKTRWWVIGKLAGKDVVLLNAKIQVIDRLEDKNVLGRATDLGNGFLMNDCSLYCDDEKMLLISNSWQKK